MIALSSMSPIFCTSDDSNFHSLNLKKHKDMSEYRFSLFYIGFGRIKLYIITRCKGKLEFHHILDLENYTRKVSKTTIHSYERHLRQNMNNGTVNEIEFLKYSIEEEKNRLDLSYTKIGSCLTISSIIIPLFITFLAQNIQLIFRANSLLYFAILAVIAYNSINFYLMVHSSHSVHSYHLSSFKGLKSDNSQNNLAKSYYINWQEMQSKADLFVSYTMNIQRYFNFLFFYTISFILFVIILNFK